MDYQEAIKKAETVLLEAWPDKPNHARVSIYPWDMNAATNFGPNFGLRVAEVSLDQGNAGASWMQSDVEAGGVLFHVERYILELVEPTSDEDLADAKWRMLHSIHGREQADKFYAR